MTLTREQDNAVLKAYDLMQETREYLDDAMYHLGEVEEDTFKVLRFAYDSLCRVIDNMSNGKTEYNSEIIFSDGVTLAVRPEKDKFTLQELQAVVGGHIEITWCKDGRYMVVNEEGKLLGLPLNVKATGMHLYKDGIVGNVLVCPDSLID